LFGSVRLSHAANKHDLHRRQVQVLKKKIGDESGHFDWLPNTEKNDRFPWINPVKLLKNINMSL